MRPLLSLFLIFCFPLFLFSATYNGQIFSFPQPDGSLVDVRLFGTELYLRAEGLDGYTLIREGKNGWICYARLNENHSEFISTGRQYFGKQNDSQSLKTWKDIPLHLDIPSEFKLSKIKNTDLQLAAPGHGLWHHSEDMHTEGTPVHPVSGQIQGLCILIDFSDEPATLPTSEYIGFCNDLNYNSFGNNGSLRTFYRDVSKGKLDYQNTVVGFFRAPRRFSYYDSLPYAQGAQTILHWALEKLDSAGFDFNSLTINEENNTIMAINLMYTGNPPTWAQGMWHHKGYLNSFVSSTGVGSGDYNCSPAGAPLGIGVVAHENGHMIGKWPDTYKYNSDSGPDGIGAFDLMCSYGDAQNPVPPNPLFRWNAGWVRVEDVSNFNGLVTDTSNLGSIRVYNNLSDSAEFFIMEARKKAGRSLFIPSEGLTVWRINRRGNNQTLNHEVKLIPASNNFNSQNNACFRAVYRPQFNAQTTPNSNWGNNDQSGLKISAISAPGNVMTYQIGPGTNAAVLKLQYLGLFSDQNSNGFIDPGETIAIKVKVRNSGLSTSGLVTGTCSGIAPNTNLFTIQNPSLTQDSLIAAQETDWIFFLQIAPDAEPGKEITLRFQASEGGNSLYITRNLMIGPWLNMVNDIDTICGATFFDPSGNAPYEAYTNLTMTLFPKSPGSKLKVQFSEFDLEQATNCQYDFLKVYNGPSRLSSMFGTFCGTTIPGPFQSTHASGALTFWFKTDDGGEGEGWKALVSCLSTTENATIVTTGEWKAYPNPGNEWLYLPQPGETYKATLLSLDGKVLREETISPERSNEWSLSAYNSGIYALRISLNGRIFVQKVVIQH